MTTIHFTAIFVLMCVQMVLVGVLCAPMPTKWRTILYRTIVTSQLLKQVHFYLKVVFFFVFVLFLDSANGAFRQATHSQMSNIASPNDTSVQWNSKVFRAQRNLYLTGFTLFLSLLLNRFIGIMGEIVSRDLEIAQLRLQLNGPEVVDLKPKDKKAQ